MKYYALRKMRIDSSYRPGSGHPRSGYINVFTIPYYFLLPTKNRHLVLVKSEE